MWRCLALGGFLALVPSAASAHSPFPGIGSFYQGLLHPLIDVGQALALAGFGMVLGQNAARIRGPAWIGFSLAMIIGLSAAWLQPMLYAPEWWIIVFALIAGAAVAAAQPLPASAVWPFGAAMGLVVGIITMPAPAALPVMLLFILGSFIGVQLIMVYALSAARWAGRQADHRWLPIGVRILGSWVLAVSALMLALAWRVETGS